ncbi:MAG: FAD-dependent oxidoreductase [Dehalococcoidia bacterium]|nr:FAD-dependent oxidoreductase [Dehalococcoidia bacterium]
MSGGTLTPATLNVAIIGAGPAAFYAAEALLRDGPQGVQVDMFDRLPTPFGLVRHGVAPDHQKIKNVTKSFGRVADDPRFRFFGNVEFGRDLSLEDIRAHYHQVLFATGAQTDRRMNIPGEDLRGSHPATAFVAWYNGHPDFQDCQFDLSQERVVVVGVGNVAVDVARILCLSREEMERTDMPRHVIEALSNSRVREVHLLGRRGPAQAAFTNPELKELGHLAEADLVIRPGEAALDELSRAELEASGDRMLQRKVDMIAEFAARQPEAKKRQLFLRFFVSPVELAGDVTGTVTALKLVRTHLVPTETGTLAAEPTGEFETIETGLVFRSVGYRGVPVPGVPFHERWGVILNESGRVLDEATHEPLPGMYTSGWIKRGPSGVIGTNKPDSVETVTAMLEDAAAGRTFAPVESPRDAYPATFESRGLRCVTFDDWSRIDAVERALGAREGRPRAKLTSVAEMLACLETPAANSSHVASAAR